jgi:prepilin-type processing-associated H-X9-DG protein
MVSPVEFLMFLAFFAVAWFGWSSLKVREIANRVAREYCQAANVQFLDGSVGFGNLGLVRDGGKLLLKRVYLFDYSESSVTRRQAAIIFIGGRFSNLVLMDE